MNNLFKTLIMGVGMILGAHQATEAKIVNGKFVRETSPVGIIGKKSEADLLNQNAGKKAAFGMANARLPRKASLEPTAQVSANSFGYLEGTDGSSWYYTQEDTYSGYDIKSSHVVVYDNHHKKKGEFTVAIPQDIRVNYVEVYGRVTQKLFDKNSYTSEVTVYLHEITPDYVGKDHIYVYNLDDELVTTFIGSGLVVDASPNSWTTYQRFILSYDDEEGNTNIDIMRPASWNEQEMQLEKKIEKSNQLINYIDAPYFNFVNINNDPYYVFTYYEKPFVEYDEDGMQKMDETTWMPLFTPDNRFIVETYDKNFNKVDSLVIPVVPSSSDYLVRLMGLGAFSDMDITKGYFTQDDQFNYIVMNEDVTITTEYKTSFDVYTQGGEQYATLAENVGDFWKHLAPVKGEEDQWIFLKSDGSSLFGVNVPSCESFDLPVDLGVFGISANIDRIADKDSGYKYVMGVNEASTDDGVNVIASYAYLDRNFKVERLVDINLGPLAQTFSPLINEQSLNPALFNTDQQREFIFLSKATKNSQTTEGYNILSIANEKGEIIHQFGGANDTAHGDIYTASIINYGTPEAALMVCYCDYETGLYTLQHYSLPFTKFSLGGDGTAENPYLISSVGDLSQIYTAPDAHFRLANDIDAYGFPVAMESEFNGTLDGDKHAINNLDVSSSNYYGGLFGITTGATIKDLRLDNPTATLSAENSYFGLLSGYSVSSKIENVVVENARISGNTNSSVGGFVGQMAADGNISGCYMKNADVSVEASQVGGFVGEARTSTSVNGSAFTGTVNGRNDIGGVVGVLGNGCHVNDCYVEASVKGKNNLGGVAGSCGVNGNRASITNCVVAGTTITTDTNVGVGGIAGFVQPEWEKTDSIFIRDNVTINTAIVANDNTTDFSSSHCIAGWTITNEPDTKRVETGMTGNYCCISADYEIPAGAVCVAKRTNTDDKSVEGAYVTTETLADNAFWTSHNYKFGYDNSQPWVLESLAYTPSLYVMDEDFLPSFICQPAVKADGKKLDGIYNLAGQRIAAPVKGMYIVNGKKYIK